MAKTQSANNKYVALLLPHQRGEPDPLCLSVVGYIITQQLHDILTWDLARHELIDDQG